MTSANASVQEPAASEEGVCQTDYIDEGKVAAVQAALPPSEVSERVADAFSALADPTRLRLLYALSLEELCVCDLAQLVGRSMATTSRQLQLLRRMGLVKYRAAGKLVYYTLDSPWAQSLVHEAVQRLGRKEAS